MTLPEGLIHVPGSLTEAEERDVLAVLATFELQPYVLHDTPSRRLVRSFGLARVAGAYDVGPAAPIPVELEWLRERCAGQMGREPEELVQLLASRYPPGAGIGWHRDAPQFGDVAGISLQTPCRMGSGVAAHAPGRRPSSPSSPAPHTSSLDRRGHNGSTTSLRSRRSGGR